MSDLTRASLNECFSYKAGAEAFNSAYVRMLAEMKADLLSQYMSPQNAQRFKHGGEWILPGASDAILGGMQTHSATVETNFQELVDNDLGAIGRTTRVLIESMHQQFSQMLYSTVSDACEQAGNIVDAQAEGSLVDAFIAMLEKIDFVADKYGNVHLPQIHTGTDTAEKLKSAAESATPEEKERIESIKAEKENDAIRREAERKAKFVCYGDCA